MVRRQRSMKFLGGFYAFPGARSIRRRGLGGARGLRGLDAARAAACFSADGDCRRWPSGSRPCASCWRKAAWCSPATVPAWCGSTRAARGARATPRGRRSWATGGLRRVCSRGRWRCDCARCLSLALRHARTSRSLQARAFSCAGCPRARRRVCTRRRRRRGSGSMQATATAASRPTSWPWPSRRVRPPNIGHSGRWTSLLGRCDDNRREIHRIVDRHEISIPGRTSTGGGRGHEPRAAAGGPSGKFTKSSCVFGARAQVVARSALSAWHFRCTLACSKEEANENLMNHDLQPIAVVRFCRLGQPGRRGRATAISIRQ